MPCKSKGKGWHRESRRHALASKGVKTGRKSTRTPVKDLTYEQEDYIIESGLEDTRKKRTLHSKGISGRSSEIEIKPCTTKGKFCLIQDVAIGNSGEHETRVLATNLSRKKAEELKRKFDPKDGWKRDTRHSRGYETEQERQDRFVRMVGGRNKAEQLDRIWKQSYPRYGYSEKDRRNRQLSRDEVFEESAKEAGFTQKQIDMFSSL